MPKYINPTSFKFLSGEGKGYTCTFHYYECVIKMEPEESLW